VENLVENIEESEQEFMVLKDLSLHPNLPGFYGLYLKRTPRLETSQLWFVMEVYRANFILLLSALSCILLPRLHM